ncbi:hypothetical protein [Flavobacterium sp.]|uniref:hypothetical protein n=1 Tax=Flavobacterium sp. TaxID=239 RepID=UPI0039E5B8F5
MKRDIKKSIIKLFHLIILISVLISCKNKTKNVDKLIILDSIQNYLETANNLELDSLTSVKNRDRATKLINQLPKDSLYFKNKIFIAFCHYNINDFEGYKRQLQRLFIELNKENEAYYGPRILTYLGEYYSLKLKMDSAILNFRKSKILYENQNNKGKIGYVYLLEAIAKANVSDYLGSEQAALMALSYLINTNSDDDKIELYNLLGIASIELNKFENANYYLNKAFNLASKKTKKIFT